MLSQQTTRSSYDSSEPTPARLEPHGTESDSSEPPEAYTQQVKKILSTPQSVERIASLARTLSRRVAADGPFAVDPDDFDLAVLLRYLRQQSQAQGLESAAAGVAFRGLTATGYDISAAYAPTVEEMLRSMISWPGKFFRREKPPLRNIIQNCIGVVKSGEMLFVVGRPGAGCSTLLRCCTGETEAYVDVTGEFSYDGLGQEEMMKSFKGYVVYNPELDNHFPLITVKQTIDFALKCKTPSTRIDGISRQEYIDTMRDLWCTVFGLRHTYNTNVGNDFVRGVSGGERKRVSIVEALACHASIYAWDNATRGLDASTALEFTQAIRTATNLLNNSAMVAIYQAGENIYELFDKVLVLYLGRQIYYGPAQAAKGYFERMGWAKPPRMTTPEFLTSVTDPNGRTPRPGFEGKVPTTAEEFEAYWHSSPEFAAAEAEYEAYCAQHPQEATRTRLQTAKQQRKHKMQRANSRYVATFWAQLGYVTTRGFQRARGEFTYQCIYLSSFLTKGFIVGSMFWHIPHSTAGAYSVGGILFYVELFCALTSLAEIAHSYAHRPIVSKQQSYAMYHRAAEALQEIITELPIKMVAVLILGLTSYWMPALKHTAGAFFAYMLFLLMIQQCMSFTFKLVATLTYDGCTAHAVAGLWCLLLCIYSGFILPLPQMHHWFKWFNWLNPMRYTFEELLAFQFHGVNIPCAEMVPSGSSYPNVPIFYQTCNSAGAVAGQNYVDGGAYMLEKFGFRFSHVWRNFGIMIAWTAGFIMLYTAASEFIKNVESAGDMLLYKRGALPKEKSESVDGKVASREEMMEALNGPDADLEAVVAARDVFSWKNLDYVIPYAGATRQLLCDVQGYVKPGTMTALMGESGAGKTTLLNVLSQRIHFGTITGDMLVNGRPVDASFQRRTGYVQQQDLHLAEYTVRESLQFAAELRQPYSVPKAEKMEYVEKIINLLGMTQYADSIVGRIGRGLNVEQRKKLSIGVELVAKPDLLLFLDEPTSGLDSQSSWSIIQFLRALADSGQAILCTIHQPSATLFEVFDRLLLLKKGGQTVYFGDIGPNSATLLSYFERQSGVKCGVSENPAEYILNCIGAGATASASEDWHQLWLKSPECAAATAEIDRLHAELPSRPLPADAESLKAKFATPYRHQLWFVFKRTGLQFWRSPIYIRAKFLECVTCSLFVGFSFVHVNHSLNDASKGILSTFMMLIISLAMINQMHVYAYDSRELFEVRESESNTFHWSVLLLSQTFCEIISSSVCQFLCFVTYYFPARFPATPQQAGYYFLAWVVMFPIYYCSYGLWILYMSPNVPSASMINSNLFAMLLLFCGILQPVQFMPGFWTFMYKVSPYTYFVQSFVAPLVHNRALVCTTEEYIKVNPMPGMSCGEYLADYVSEKGGYVFNEEASAPTQCLYCPYTNQAGPMQDFNIYWHYRWRNFGFFWIYIGFNFIAMLGCYYLFRVKVWNIGIVAHIKSWFAPPRKDRHEKDTTIFQQPPAPAVKKE